MNNKRPYTHILKNLFHEQAEELIPLLLPGFLVEQVLDIELPELRTIETNEQPSEMEQGLVGLVVPEAKLLNVIKTEWIEHSGKFERAYRVHSPETDKPSYLLIEFQTERNDKDLPRRLLSHFARVNIYVKEDVVQEEDEDEGEHKGEHKGKRKGRRKGTIMNPGYYVYPEVLCPFPTSVPAHIRDEFRGQVMLSFDFLVIGLWERDAREFLNTHISASYFLLPAMKNADATLLGLAIEGLAQRFQNDDRELGRHLTGLSLMLHQSEVMSEEEKLVAQGHLKRFAHLIKDDPYEG
jgi:hypothetical protein